jgi:hypothetical protein
MTALSDSTPHGPPVLRKMRVGRKEARGVPKAVGLELAVAPPTRSRSPARGPLQCSCCPRSPGAARAVSASYVRSVFESRSGRRGSNSRPLPWQGSALPRFRVRRLSLYRTCATHEPTLVTRRAHSTHVTELASRRRLAVLGREAAQTWAVRRDHRRPPWRTTLSHEAGASAETEELRCRPQSRCQPPVGRWVDRCSATRVLPIWPIQRHVDP